jgi:hypothetical protein
VPFRARQPIRKKCQPRNEADAIRRFLLRAKAEQTVSDEQDRVTRETLDRFEQQVHAELRQLDQTIDSLRYEHNLELFPLNGKMLERAMDLTAMDLALQPFDQAILAAVLVRAEELRSDGELEICFCETDSDLQPWDKNGAAKPLLTNLYDAAEIWVYSDFDLRAPERPQRWPN